MSRINKKPSGYYKKRQPPKEHDEPIQATRTNRWIVGIIVCSILMFTVGMVAGIRIGRYQQIETRILNNSVNRNKVNKKNARENSTVKTVKKQGKTLLSNINNQKSDSSNFEDKNYVILLGSFSPGNAKKLLLKIHNNRDISKIKPLPCKSVQETIPNRLLGFRLINPKNHKSNRVYLGCFNNIKKARQVYSILEKSPLWKKITPKLVEIK